MRMRYMSCSKLAIGLAAISIFANGASAKNCSPFAFGINRDATLFLHVQLADRTNGEAIKSDGTGFIVSARGFVLTTNHIFKPEGNYELKGISGWISSRNSPQMLQLTVVRRDEDDDLALLKITATDQTYSKVMIEKTHPADAAQMCSGGFPGSEDYHPYSGLLGSDYLNQWTADMASNTGDSGSPVFIATGEVVAIKKGAFQNEANRSVLIPISAASGLLARVDDLESACEIESAPQNMQLPPYKPRLEVDSRDVGESLGTPFKFPCGRHNFKLSIDWDLRLIRLPDRSDSCETTSTTDSGNRYILQVQSVFTDPSRPFLIDSCKLELDTSVQ
jgi:hypothetical protein